MIKNYNDAELVDVHEKYRLLFLLWKELTDYRTMDSYQYRVMNSLNILQELVDEINNRLCRYSITNHGVIECKVEASDIISKDSTIKTHFPQVYGQLLKHLNQKVETDMELKALKYQIEYYYDLISKEYLTYLFDDLELSIDYSNHKEITMLVNMLISICVCLGWSIQALNSVVDELKGSAYSKDKWLSFKTLVTNQATKEFIVFIPLKLDYKYANTDKNTLVNKVHAEIKSMGIDVCYKCKIGSKYPQVISYLNDNSPYMVVTVDGFDPFSACYSAINKCSNALNLLSFFNYTEAWNVKNNVFMVCDSSNTVVSLVKERKLFSTYDYLESSQKIYSATKDLVGSNDPNTSVKNKLISSFSYANHAKAAVLQEEKLMNLWVALESLCRSDVYENIISNVLEAVPPALCIRYMYRLFRNFLEDCLRCGLDFDSVSIQIENRDRSEIVRDIIALMRDSSRYSAFLGKCSINALLVVRCEEIHELATDEDKAVARIRKHYTNVRRQLARLYRIRNGIAHSAMDGRGSLGIFIEHLSDYLSCFISEIVMYSTTEHEYRAEVIFEIFKDNYQTFIELAKPSNKAGNCLLSNFQASGIIDLI